MESNNFTPNNTDGKNDNPPRLGRFSPDLENSQQRQQKETPLNSLDLKYIYRDFSHVQPSHSTNNEQLEPAPRTLPAKLNSMLSDSSLSDVITWLPHGRSWRILDRDRFTHEVLPKYFEHSNFNSFVRLVNAWGFRRVPHGIDVDSHYHELFLRGMPHLHARMKRTSLNERKAPIDSKDRCPNFSSMPPLSGISPNNDEATTNSSEDLRPQQRQDRAIPNDRPRANHDVEQSPNQISSVVNPSCLEIATSPRHQNHSIANAPIQNNIVSHPSVFISNPAAIQITSPVGPLHQIFPFGDPNSGFVQQQISSVGSGCSQPQPHSGILQPQQYQLVLAQLLLQQQQQQQQQQLFIQPPLQHSQHYQHLQNFLSMGYLHPNIGNQAIPLLGNINPLPPQQIYNTSFPLQSVANGVNPQQCQSAIATTSLGLAQPQLNSANLVGVIANTLENNHVQNNTSSSTLLTEASSSQQGANPSESNNSNQFVPLSEQGSELSAYRGGNQAQGENRNQFVAMANLQQLPQLEQQLFAHAAQQHQQPSQQSRLPDEEDGENKEGGPN